MREAKATSRVTHPNVVEVIDVGVDAESERLYLIEELLEGDDLRARMRARRRMSTQEVRAVIGPVLDGLGAALAEGATLAEAQARSSVRVEAATLVPRVVAFAKEHRLDAAIFTAIEAVFSGRVTREAMLSGLMERR